MIVMKFGGASLASAASMKRVASIVHSELHRRPIVIVSAIGETTDRLLEILGHASRANLYLASKLQDEVRAEHFCLAEDLLGPEQLEPIDRYLRQTFRDLHVRMLEVAEGDCGVTPELHDWVASMGEQLSSRIVAAALQASGLSTMHQDATKLILTDENFTHATPRHWETYARIRWAVPVAARDHVVVLGGFIGSSEDGRTTTLGRGGSDLTASLVGAAVNADEIQVWKDVDGMLTWDPRIKTGGYRLKRLSYEEANALAQAGATILHPETIAPARRLRIPVVIRNTFRPTCEGTRIGSGSTPSSNAVKSIACKTNLTIVELRAPSPDKTVAEHSQVLDQICQEQNGATLLAVSDKAIYLALENKGVDPNLKFPFAHCLEARVRPAQALITLVGQELKENDITTQLTGVLHDGPAFILPRESDSCSVRIVVPQKDLAGYIDILQRALFSKVDPAFFASAEPSQAEPRPNQRISATLVAPAKNSREIRPNSWAWRPFGS